jgi:hypothetical protein
MTVSNDPTVERPDGKTSDDGQVEVAAKQVTEAAKTQRPTENIDAVNWRFVVIVSVASVATVIAALAVAWGSWPAAYFIIGYSISLPVGAVVAYLFWVHFHRMAEEIERGPKESQEYRAFKLPVAIGLVERLLITTLVGFDVGGSAGFIGAWITIKAVGGWAKIAGPSASPYARAVFMAGLLSSAVSAFMAIVGGLVISVYVHPGKP